MFTFSKVKGKLDFFVTPPMTMAWNGLRRHSRKYPVNVQNSTKFIASQILITCLFYCSPTGGVKLDSLSSENNIYCCWTMTCCLVKGFFLKFSNLLAVQGPPTTPQTVSIFTMYPIFCDPPEICSSLASSNKAMFT